MFTSVTPGLLIANYTSSVMPICSGMHNWNIHSDVQMILTQYIKSGSERSESESEYAIVEGARNTPWQSSEQGETQIVPNIRGFSTPPLIYVGGLGLQHGYPPLLGDIVDVDASANCKCFLAGVDGWARVGSDDCFLAGVDGWERVGSDDLQGVIGLWPRRLACWKLFLSVL